MEGGPRTRMPEWVGLGKGRAGRAYTRMRAQDHAPARWRPRPAWEPTKAGAGARKSVGSVSEFVRGRDARSFRASPFPVRFQICSETR